MAWPGWFSYAGTEIINVDRTEAYAPPGWFKAVYKNGNLGPMMGEVYASPLQDDAPWTDPDDLNSYDFWGVYPLDVGGIEDSTATATVQESTLDGGLVGRSRRTTRTMTFSAVLIGASECAVEYGLRWLKQVLAGGPCGGSNDTNCGGNDLCFLRCEPTLDWASDGDPTDCLDGYVYSLRKVAPTVGPSIDNKMEMANGGVAWAVSFTLVAGDPHKYSTEIELIQGFGNPAIDMPYVGGLPDGGQFDDSGFVQTEQPCPVLIFNPLQDPECPQIVPPPGVPNIALNCFTFPVNYVRYQFTVPPQFIPLWGDVVPIVDIHTTRQAVRALRLRFYADPTGSGDPNSDPCNYCGDVVFSYIPPNSTIVFDGIEQTVYIDLPGGGRQRADALVFGSDGLPFDWPSLSCGFGYIVTMDIPQSTPLPVIDMALATRVS